MRLLGADDQQAEDLTQETFMALVDGPFEYINESSTSAYLRRVARNLFLNMIRSSRKHQHVELDEADAVWDEYVQGEDSDAWLESLKACLEHVDSRSRDILDLKYKDNRDLDYITKHASSTLDGVKSVLKRARAKLRDCVKRRLEHE